MEDQQIIALYMARDEQAIVETDQKYGAFCHRIARNLLSLREDAEECVNDTYLATWNQVPPQQPRSFPAFLGRIVRNLSISRFRKCRAQKRYDGLEVMLSELDDCVPARGGVEQILEQKQLTREIGRWLDGLDQDDRVVFMRRYWYGDGVRNLAKEWRCTSNQMAQRMLRLRKNLQKTLEMEELL